MKALASFITKFNKVILILMLILCLVCALLMTQVEINGDLTKYLANDSSMKIGTDIMAEEMDTSGVEQTIRVMFDDLTDSEKEEVLVSLESIPYVDSVSYESGSEDYNSDNHTLYIVNTLYGYDTSEEHSIEKSLKQDYKDYDMTYKNDNASAVNLPAWVVALAMVVLLTVLFIMSNSWTEAILFMVTTGIAVVINLGTNIFMGSVSNITFSIAAILQLILSMDYSIILMSRYRQEYQRCGEKHEAMRTALARAFSSVASSGLTTVVGLLMLCFMSFKIGMDLGIVLAKGVLISMICVFLVLPGLVLMCHGLIQRTAKKVPEIPLFHISGGVFKLRKFFIPFLILLFFGAMLLQTRTDVAYTMNVRDPIADVFPTSNSVVLLYNNEDEEEIAGLVDYFADDPYIRDASSYPTLLGKPYTAEEMADSVGDMSEDMEITPEMLSILYYDYYSGDDLPELTVSEFLHFLTDYVAEDDTFSAYLSDDMLDNMDLMAQFADPDTLTQSMTSAQMADFFDMDEADLDSLFLYYFIEHDTVDPGTMTLPVFADFVVNEVAQDPDYGDLFDQDTLEELETLTTYTDAQEMTAPRSYASMAEVLGMDSDSVRLLYIYYYSLQEDYTPGGMTVNQFVSLLVNDISKDTTISSLYDLSELSQVSALQPYLDTSTVQTRMSAASLAAFFGMEEEDVDSLLLLYYMEHGGVDTGTMTLPVFADFVVHEIAEDPTYAALFDQDTLAQLSLLTTYTDAQAMTTPLTYTQMAGGLGIDADSAALLYAYRYAMDENFDPGTMTLGEFLQYLCKDASNNALLSSYLDEESLALMETMLVYTDVETITAEQSPGDLADFFDMDESTVRSLLMLYAMTHGLGFTSDVSLSPYEFVDFLVTTVASNEAYSAYLDEDTLTQLTYLQTMMQLSVSGVSFTPEEMGDILGMDSFSLRLMYTLKAVEEQGLTLTTQEILHFLAENTDTFGDLLGDMGSYLTMACEIVDASVAGEAFTPEALAGLVGMSQDQAEQLFLLYTAWHGDTSSWKLSPLTMVDFLVSDVAGNPDYAALLDASTLSQLQLVRTLMHAAVNGTVYTYTAMAELFGMDRAEAKMLFTYHDALSKAASWRLSVQSVMNFLVEHADQFGSLLGDNLDLLTTARDLINGSVAGTAYAPGEIASLLGMEADQARQLYLLYCSRHGDTASWQMSIEEFVNFVQDNVLTNPDYADLVDPDSAQLMDTAQLLVDAVLSGKVYTPAELAELFAGLTDEMDEDSLELLYLYYGGVYNLDPTWTLSIHQMFSYLADDLVSDPRFSTLLGEDLKESITDMRDQLEDGIAQMKGEHYAILAFTTTYPDESEETSAFLDELVDYADAHLSGDYYLIGNSPMVREMEEGFNSELRLITILTAVAIFLVVAFTFRSILIPLILVLCVQCGVYITMSTCALINYSIYYLALLIVQCILMGATIDYGILYTNYYREYRRRMGRRDSMRNAYKGASHTIFTSGLIMILVTLIIGISPADPMIGQICITIAMGVTAAILVIIFVLPGVLVAADRFVVPKKNRWKSE